MTFPGANSTVYYNEAGEPLGWDNHYDGDEPYDPDDYLGDYEPDDLDDEPGIDDDDDDDEAAELEHHEREHPDGDPVTVR